MRPRRLAPALLILSVSLLAASPGHAQDASAEKPPPAAPALEDLLQYTGIYPLGPDHDLAVSVRRAGGRTVLLASDIRTGAIRMLFPAGSDAFHMGPEILVPEPPEARLTFRRDASGAVTGLTFRDLRWGRETEAAKVPLRSLPVEFHRAGLRFGGTLFLPPPGGGPWPGIILATGSEDNDRYSMDAMPLVLARHGIAVLAYDKRGTGVSGGDWSDAGLEDLAADLVAGLEVLAARPEVDASRLGVIGFSEGGWVAPLASSMTPSIRFIVSISGGAFTKGDSFLHKYRVRFSEEGLEGEALEKAMAGKRAIVEESARKVREGDSPSGFDRRITYDPAEDWRSFRGPVLYLVGEDDTLEPARRSADRLAEILGEAGHPDYTIKVFPRAHHAMFLGVEGTPSEFQSMRGISRLSPGYWDVLLRWLEVRLDRGGLGPLPAPPASRRAREE